MSVLPYIGGETVAAYDLQTVPVHSDGRLRIDVQCDNSAHAEPVVPYWP